MVAATMCVAWLVLTATMWCGPAAGPADFPDTVVAQATKLRPNSSGGLDGALPELWSLGRRGNLRGMVADLHTQCGAPGDPVMVHRHCPDHGAPDQPHLLLCERDLVPRTGRLAGAPTCAATGGLAGPGGESAAACALQCRPELQQR
eukprot:1181392-Prorocentrum_minimum.AAC.3